MIRSLRLRVFLIVWPLVVIATVAVGLFFGRWTRMEIENQTYVNVTRPQAPAGTTGRVADTMLVTEVNKIAPEMFASAQRTIWTTILIASIVAALATLLLARPIVAQVQRLGAAAHRIRGGAFDTRVAVTSSDELGRLEQSFNDMAEQLGSSETSKRRMTSDIAHELRTPLTNIIGLLEAMRDGMRAPDAETLDSAREEAELLHALIEELQDLTLAESGALKLEMQRLDAVDEARRAVTAMQVAGGARVIAPPEDAAAWIVADRRRLQQVLRNLLQNALTHSDAEGKVRVEVMRDLDDVVMRITDSGAGIPAAHLPLIWERFHRVDPSRARATGGMGLGLALVKELVERMGGRVSVESEEGRGSVFSVRFPNEK